MSRTPSPPSPCLAICVMDKDTGFCKGCYRTLEEIGRWAVMTIPERYQVLDAVADRRDTLGADKIEAERRRQRAERRQNRRRAGRPDAGH